MIIGAQMTGSVLSGDLEFLGLADLLQLIGNNGATGVLRLVSPYAPAPATVYIDKGNPVHASQGELSGTEAIMSLFGWTRGTFEFLDSKVPVRRAIKKNRMELILDGLRMMDDGKVKVLGNGTQSRTTVACERNQSGLPIIKGPLVDYIYIADEETYHDGDVIVEEGKHGSWMWVVLEGRVDIVKATPKGSMTISSISEGSFLGDIATFLAREHVRGASAIARGDVQLGVVDSQRLSNEFSALSRGLRDTLLSFDRRLRLVSGSALHIRLGQPRLAELQEGMAAYTWERPDTADDTEPPVLSLTAGNALVARAMGPEAIPVVLADLQPGDYIGRIPFLEMGLEPDSAVVYTTADTILTPLDWRPFQQEFDRLSQTFKNIVTNISVSIAATARVASDCYKEGFHKGL